MSAHLRAALGGYTSMVTSGAEMTVISLGWNPAFALKWLVSECQIFDET